MKLRTLIICLISILFLSEAIAQVSGNALSRVLFLRNIIENDTLFGTGFVIEYEQKTYLISAKHVFPTAINNGPQTFDFFAEEQWLNVTSPRVFIHNNRNVDIIVIPMVLNFIHPLRLQGEDDTMFFGEEGFFLGFPLGVHSNNGNLNSGFPFPLIKSLSFSGISNIDGTRILLFDGLSNPGFSGGPILYGEVKNGQFVIGIIKGSLIQSKDIIINDSTTVTFNDNSGIIVGFPTFFVKEIIQANQ